MEEFVLLFRIDITTKELQPTRGQMEAYMQQWHLWIDGLVAEDRLAEGGHHLSREGKVIRSPKVVNEGPYIDNKVSIAGYILILAKDLEEATAMAKDCPILLGEGNSVEVRKVGAMNNE